MAQEARRRIADDVLDEMREESFKESARESTREHKALTQWRRGNISIAESKEKLNGLTQISYDEFARRWKALIDREEARGDDAWTRHVPQLDSLADEFAMGVLQEMLSDGDIEDQHEECLRVLKIERGSSTDLEFQALLQRV
jgi:hypothetical protein